MMDERTKRAARLAALIEAARNRPPMTDAELEAQRRSWVRGEMGLGSDADEAAYREALRDGDAATLDRLDREAAKRMALISAPEAPR
jgi:hypothetical protein